MNACRICLQTFTRGTSLDRHLVTTRCGDLLKEARRRRVEAATSVDGVSIDGHASKRHRSDDDNNADCDIGNPDDGDMHNFYAENDFVPIADIADDDINATDGFVDDDSEDSSEYFDESSDEDDVAAGVDEQRRVDGDDGDGDGGAVEGDFDKDLSHALHELIHQGIKPGPTADKLLKLLNAAGLKVPRSTYLLERLESSQRAPHESRLVRMYPENASKDSRVAAYLSIEDAMEMLLESVSDLRDLHQVYEPSALISAPWNARAFEVATAIFQPLATAKNAVIAHIRTFDDGFSVNSFSSYSINGFYLQLAGVHVGRIVPFALLPPYDVDAKSFYVNVIVPELAKLARGITIRYRGRSINVIGDVVAFNGDHVGLAKLMNVPSTQSDHPCRACFAPRGSEFVVIPHGNPIYALRDGVMLKHMLTKLSETASDAQRKLLVTQLGVTWPPSPFLTPSLPTLYAAFFYVFCVCIMHLILSGHCRLLLLNLCRVYGISLVRHVNNRVASLKSMKNSLALVRLIQHPELIKVSKKGLTLRDTTAQAMEVVLALSEYIFHASPLSNSDLELWRTLSRLYYAMMAPSFTESTIQELDALAHHYRSLYLKRFDQQCITDFPNMCMLRHIAEFVRRQGPLFPWQDTREFEHTHRHVNMAIRRTSRKRVEFNALRQLTRTFEYVYQNSTVRAIMKPPCRAPRPPYTVGKRSTYESLANAALTPSQRAAVVAALLPGVSVVGADLSPFVVAKCGLVYISGHRVAVDAFVDIGGRLNNVVVLRGLANIASIYAIARRSNEREPLATLVHVRLLQTQSPVPSDVGRNRFEPTQTYYDLCLTHERMLRTIEIVNWATVLYIGNHYSRCPQALIRNDAVDLGDVDFEGLPLMRELK